MKYHLVLTPVQISIEIDSKQQSEIKELNREMLGTLKKIVKREENTCRELFYLYDTSSMKRLKQLLSNPSDESKNDELFIHAEGYPFMISPSLSGGPYALTAYELAKFLKENVLSEHPLSINLLACNSATNFQGSNFSRDLSCALTFSFEFSNINVIGYTGYILVKNNGKFSVSSVLGASIKGTHASLDDAKMIYSSGEPIQIGKQLIKDLSHYSYDWARDYIERMYSERKYVKLEKYSERKGKDILLQHSMFNKTLIDNEQMSIPDQKPI